MKNNTTKILMGVIILAVVIVIGTMIQNNNNNDDSNAAVNVNFVEDSKLSIITTIDNGESQISYDKKVSSGTTALEVINIISEEDGVVLETTEYDFGILIDSIDRVGEDTEDGKYWTFYVNNEMASVGVADYTVNDNDSILMKYQAL